MNKFKSLTSAGCKASLNFTAEGGKISVMLSADLGYCVPPPFVNVTSFSPKMPRRGPAYLRRQRRRKEATEKCSLSNASSSSRMENETLVEVDEVNDSESNTVEVSNLATEQQSKKVADQPSKDVDEKSSEAVVKPAAENDWIVTRIRSYAAEFKNPEYLYPSYAPVCCSHNHIPGRGGHNVPKDGSQCCYHRCKKNPHYLSTKPK